MRIWELSTLKAISWERLLLCLGRLSFNVTLSFSLQYNPPDYLPKVYEELPMTPSHREVVINAFVYVHQTLHQANERLAKRGGRVMAITPRHYLDFINHYVSIRIEGEVRLYYHEYLSQKSQRPSRQCMFV